MTHENAALSAAMGETMITGKPSATAAHVECGMINAGGVGYYLTEYEPAAT